MFSPKKSLSQNFLRDEGVIRNIARLGEAHHFEWIVEIGAGEGVLTEVLAQEARHVIALEFDRDLIPRLLKRFPISSDVSVVETNILHTNIVDLLEKKGGKDRGSWAIFGNIPYAITGKIIRLLVSMEKAPDTIVLMVQKEVAERIVAKNGKQNILSLAVALFGKAEILFLVPKDAFFPAPEVESAVIRITPDKERLSNEEREHILRLAKIGFASKRKTLANNFAANPKYSKEEVENFLKSINKSLSTRAEELSVEEWVKLKFSFMENLHQHPNRPQSVSDSKP